MSEVAVQELRHWIGGKWVPGSGQAAQALSIYNPTTGELLAKAPSATPEDVAEAVAAAEAAWPAWRDTPVLRRVQVFFRYKALLEEHFEALARSVHEENGKTVEEARGEVRRGIECVELATSAPSLLQGSALADVSPGFDCEVWRVPLGVVAGITPFNFPAMIPLWMFPVAIACGNTFVLKPSDRTPMTAVRLAELFAEAGAPAGVLNLVLGGAETADALLRAPAVRAISFVGSEPVARHVYATAAAHGKRVQALAGAKNHLVVMPDADLDRAAPAIVASAFGNAGQRCMAGSAVVAVGAVAEPLVDRLCRLAAEIQLGEDMGPVIRPEHRERILAYIERGLAEGARLRLDGRTRGQDRQGFFLGPTIFDEVRPEMAIAQEEIFGPVLVVLRASDLEEAIAVCNRSRFGNGAAIFTASGAAARRFREGIQAGMVGINVGIPVPTGFFPFAGWKGSFYGDLHANGQDAFRFYTEERVVTTRWW